MKTPLLFILGSFLVVGCSHSASRQEAAQAEPRKTYTEEEASRHIDNQAAVESGAQYFAEIEFAPGSKDLKKTSQLQIEALLQRAKLANKVDQVTVLSWADDEYPSNQLKKLSQSQRNLAANRNMAIERYLKSNHKVKVETYSMAERPNIVDKWLNSPDARIKDSLMAAGLPTTASDPQYPSKASHAVILISVEKR